MVAGDAIKRELGRGQKSLVAAWLGPTKLATAIVFATITNIVAYLPFLMVGGDTGRFIYSLPVVMACALVSSRIVSMTFIPFLGYYLLRSPKVLEAPIAERRQHGFLGLYYQFGRQVIEHRWRFMAGSLVFLGLGALAMWKLDTAFFPKDLSYLSYVDVWLPEDAPCRYGCNAAPGRSHPGEASAEYGKEHPGRTANQGGAGVPDLFCRRRRTRFRFFVCSEPRQNNYAQIVIQVRPNMTLTTWSTPGVRP